MRGPAVGIAADLSLLIPKPETTEKRVIRRREGEMRETESAKRARSSAPDTFSPREKVKQRIINNDEKERGKRAALLDTP